MTLKVRFAAVRSRAIDIREDVLRRVQLLPRIATEFLRVEVIDRSMSIGAQALSALVPLLIVLAAFLPPDLTDFVTGRIGEVTGLDTAEADLLAAGGSEAVDISRVRTQTGIIGITITLLSATTFARAIQRAYVAVWDLPRAKGMAAWGICLVWLLGWLVTLEALHSVSSLDDRWAVLDEITVVAQVALATAAWWLSVRVLTFFQVGWWASFPAALITGGAMIAYSTMSTLVMPRFASRSAEQFGLLGLVLTLATWLVGFAFVVVVSAVVGRAFAEDEATQALARCVRSWGAGLLGRGGSRSDG